MASQPSSFNSSFDRHPRNSSPRRIDNDRSEATARLSSSPALSSSPFRRPRSDSFDAQRQFGTSPAFDPQRQFGTSPALDAQRFFGTSPARSNSPARSYGAGSAHDRYASDGEDDSTAGPSTIYNEPGEPFSIDLPEAEVARVVKRHLVASAASGSKTPSSTPTHDPLTGSSSSTPPHTPTPIRSVHELPGGAITHDLYKWTRQVENAQQNRRNRSQSLYLPREEDPVISQLKQPGGFRRHYLLSKAQQEGKKPPNFITKSFVDFLCLYGHFGGEDLSDDDDYEDEEEDDEEEGLSVRVLEGAAGSSRDRRGKRPSEQSPLLPKPSDQVQGTATASKAVFLLLKSFVGTGVMFLPKAFYNGGLLFSTVVLIVIAAIALIAFLLLVETRTVVPASFGDMGGILFGPKMRIAVLFSISISQIGFVCAYMVFVSQNVQALIMSLSNCRIEIPIAYLIIGQLLIFVPLAMIRKIAKLSVFALIADVFILLGLLYLYYFEFLTLAKVGIGKVALFNPTDFALFIGTAVFTYEGVGLIIPITESMKEPQKFPAVLTGTMIFITFLFTSVGFISYLTFGDKVQTVILLNLPSGDYIVDGVQALYSLAICLSIPLQLFPAIRIMENALFTRSGKNDPFVKWQKNIFRLVAVFACALIAIGGASDLDKFVALIGALCCVPLCWFFPPLFHLKAVAKNWRQKALDIALIGFGIISMFYTTYITIMHWTMGGGEQSPVNRCTVHGN